MKNSHQQILIGAAIAVCLSSLYLIHLGASSIWDSNEAFYVETPREMIRSGQYIIPTFNYEFRLNKPPLSYWIVVAAYKILGVSVYSQRLVTLLFVAGLLLVVWKFCLLFELPRRWAWFAVIVVALTPRILVMGRRALLEILITFFIVAALYFFYEYLHGGRRRNLTFFYICLALGFLTKGPVALVIPLGVIGCFWLIGGFRKPPFPVRPLSGGAIFLALVLPWYIALYMTMGPKWIIRFFWDENLLRFTTGDFGPQRGILYYPGIFLGDFFPWCLLSVGSIWYLYKIWRDLEAPVRERMVFLLVWILFPILFFSFSKNKQEYYIMSVYPAAALSLGILLSRLEKEQAQHRYWRAVLAVSWALTGVMGWGIALMVHKILGLEVVAWALGALILAIQVAGWVSLHRGRWMRLFAFIPASVFLLFLVTVVFVVPKIEDFHPIQHFARIILHQSSPTDRIGSYDFACPSLCFYTRRPILEIVKEEEFASLFSQPHPFFCVIRERNLAALDRRGIPYRVLDDRPLASLKVKDFISPPPGGIRNRLLLIVNTPGQEATGISDK